MSKIRFTGVMIALSLILLLAGCNNAGNENANANANANRAAANANMPVANSNQNANTTRRAGPTREEYESNKAKYMKEAKDAGRTIGKGVSDGWLWVKSRYELAAADDLRDSTINVDVENGVVTLTGSVPTAAQKAKAEQIVKAVEGVTGVKNMIKVTPAKANASPTPKKGK